MLPDLRLYYLEKLQVFLLHVFYKQLKFSCKSQAAKRKC